MGLTTFLPNFRAWHLINLDQGDEIKGDFEAEDLTREVSSTYAETHALNRDEPILQYLHGNSDTFSFTGRVYARNGFQEVKGKIDKLLDWARRLPGLQRPPVVLFYAGNGELSQQSVIESVSSIRYDPLRGDGSIRGATFSVTLRQYIPYSLDQSEPPETRYHKTKDGETLELICFHEYNNPLLAIAIRQRQSGLLLPLEVGQVVQLPSFDAIRTTAIKPKSITLQGLTSKKDTPQKTLREFHIDRLNRKRTSTIVPEGV